MDKIFVCDLDGVLLDTETAFREHWETILAKPIPKGAFVHWDHTLALGIPKEDDKIFWATFWDSVSIDPYPGAGWFVNRVKYLGYRFVVLTSRGSDAARTSLFRDIRKIEAGFGYEIDDLLVCDHRKENKSSYINAIEGVEFFLDDHVKNVADVQIRCPQLKRVMLFDRDWNNSLDLSGYLRVFSYGDVLSILGEAVYANI